MNNKYENIINLPHRISNKHPQMSIQSRAAQFGAFDALTGYDDEIKETARLTNSKIELNEEKKQILDMKIKIMLEHINTRPTVAITYFIQDIKKNGGQYTTEVGIIKRLDTYKQCIILENKSEIPIDEIIEIESSILEKFEN